MLEELALAIVAGTYPEQSILPSERALAEELDVSRVLVRQAVHRLAELGLLEVHQGKPTRVGSIEDASLVPLLELVYRSGGAISRHYEAFIIERQYLNGISLLELARRRGSPEALARVLRLVDEESPSSAATFLRFESRFWLAIAAAAGNPILTAELKWWYRTIAGHLPRPEVVLDTPLAARIAFHRELATRLVSGGDAVALYMAVVGPLLDVLRSTPLVVSEEAL